MKIPPIIPAEEATINRWRPNPGTIKTRIYFSMLAVVRVGDVFGDDGGGSPSYNSTHWPAGMISFKLSSSLWSSKAFFNDQTSSSPIMYSVAPLSTGMFIVLLLGWKDIPLL